MEPRSIEQRLKQLEEMMHSFLKSLVDDSGKPQRGESSQFRSMVRNGIKVEIPHFDGSEVEDWIFKLNEFFEFYRTPPEQKIQIASLHMEGATLSWYQWAMEIELVETWN